MTINPQTVRVGARTADRVVTAALPRANRPAPARHSAPGRRYTRDDQKDKVYAAEQALCTILDNLREVPTITVAGQTVVVSHPLRFGSLEAVQAYCDKVCQDQGVGLVRVRTSTRAKRALYSRDRTLTLPLHPDLNERHWAWREEVVLHELAHHLTSTPTEASHGPSFASAEVELFRTYISEEVALILGILFHQNGVRRT